MFHVTLVCHIVDNYCLGFDGGVIHVLVICDIVDNNFMMFVTAVVRVAVFHIIDNYCLSVTKQWFMNFDIEVVRVVAVGYCVYHCCLMFECGVINLCCLELLYCRLLFTFTSLYGGILNFMMKESRVHGENQGYFVNRLITIILYRVHLI